MQLIEKTAQEVEEIRRILTVNPGVEKRVEEAEPEWRISIENRRSVLCGRVDNLEDQHGNSGSSRKIPVNDNFKAVLNEEAQRKKKEPPAYSKSWLIKHEHHVNVTYDGKTYEGDPGRSVKDAQQNAARQALIQIGYYDDLMTPVPPQQLPTKQKAEQEKTPKEELPGDSSIFKCHTLGMQ